MIDPVNVFVDEYRMLGLETRLEQQLDGLHNVEDGELPCLGSCPARSALRSASFKEAVRVFAKVHLHVLHGDEAIEPERSSGRERRPQLPRRRTVVGCGEPARKPATLACDLLRSRRRGEDGTR